MSFKDKLDKDNIPGHIAIIMDGNGRWAKQRGKKRIFGHRNGVKSVRTITEIAGEIGVKYLTLYAFSTENWNRPKLEIEGLMTLLVSSIHKEIKTLSKNNVKLTVIGDRGHLSAKVNKEIQFAIDKTAQNTGLTIVVALSYSARWEIIDAVKKISLDVEQKKLTTDEINDELFSSYLTTADIPDPDLMIRTSGEQRISNFLLWQLAYSELYFSEKLWPDFGKEDFLEAIWSYQNRERRYGKTSEQI